MTQIEVAANRAMYRWAMTRDRLDPADVAHRFPNLRAWESGDASPTLRELEKFAAATHTPVGYFATLAIEAGEDIATMSRALGHSSVATTADVYMHVTPAMKDRLAQRMEDALGA